MISPMIGAVDLRPIDAAAVFIGTYRRSVFVVMFFYAKSPQQIAFWTVRLADGGV